ADPEPKLPDYKGFRLGLISLSSWKSWQAAVLKVDEISLLDLRDLVINDAWDEAQVIYNNLKAAVPPTPETIEQWQAIATQYNIPFQF
ncbi:MAG: hypothetical protein AAGF24_09590, partial [Cyanobacteria bacterium P01_H01_bin.121]